MPTVDVFIHRKENYRGEEIFNAWSMDMSSSDMCGDLVCKIAVQFELPADFNPVAAEIARLQAKEVELAEAFRASVHTIRTRLSKLQAIEWDRSSENPSNYPAEESNHAA